ncbi:enolase C-terminal domain-like protein [Streptomyces sp. NPDC001401]|uniref:enolase C-terminal domain-like protein n=1 Tax=Streptomyces sp. NPDC001401 TaxID=3364570 RepID=UPI0036BC92B3
MTAGLPVPLEVFTAEVPMARPFAHAAHARRTSRSVLVRCTLAGSTGWGEGAPRTYVTGESLESAVHALLHAQLPALEGVFTGLSFESGVRALDTLDLPAALGAPDHPAPAAAAALETALLDAWCRAHGRDAADALAVVGGEVLRPEPQVPVSALVVDSSRTPAELLGALPEEARSRLTHVKVKGLPDPAATRELVVSAREFTEPSRTTVSVDANGVWSPDQALHAATLLADAVDWLEEPTRPRDWATLHRIQREAGCPVMLDESAVVPTDLDEAIGHAAATYVNVRVSKCGGPLASLRMLRRARTLGLRAQLGVQVAEVGPLWAAGRLLAAHVDGLVAVESGRQDEWFAPDLTVPPYEIDRIRHRAAPLPGPGFGLVPSPRLLRAPQRGAGNGAISHNEPADGQRPIPAQPAERPVPAFTTRTPA